MTDYRATLIICNVTVYDIFLNLTNKNIRLVYCICSKLAIQSFSRSSSSNSSSSSSSGSSCGSSTVKPVYNDHLWDEVSVVVIDRWSL